MTTPRPDALLAEHPPEPGSAVSLVAPVRKCRRHEWYTEAATVVVNGEPIPPRTWCIRCGTHRDDTRSRLGKSSSRLGKDQERRIERVYGPRKVGEYGDAIDLLGRDFAWQSKATRSAMPAWLAAVDEPLERLPPAIVLVSARAMVPILGTRYPLVIQSWVRHGVPTRDRIWVRGEVWSALHGGAWRGWLVMSGEHFLRVHGSDAAA